MVLIDLCTTNDNKLLHSFDNIRSLGPDNNKCILKTYVVHYQKKCLHTVILFVYKTIHDNNSVIISFFIYTFQYHMKIFTHLFNMFSVVSYSLLIYVYLYSDNHVMYNVMRGFTYVSFNKC